MQQIETVSALPNVGPYIYDVSISGCTRSSIYIYDVSISGFTRSSIYIYEISSLRANIIKWQVKFNPVAYGLITKVSFLSSSVTRKDLQFGT